MLTHCENDEKPIINNPVDITFISPSADSVVTEKSSVIINVNTKLTINNVSIRIDEGEWTECLYSESQNWVKTDFIDPSNISDGSHTLYAKVFTGDGKVYTKTMMFTLNEFTYDILSPQPDTAYKKDYDIKLQMKIFGNQNPYKVKYKIDNRNWSSYVNAISSKNYHVVDSNIDVPDDITFGKHDLLIELVDANNIVKIDTISIYVYEKLTDIAITSPENNKQFADTIELSGTSYAVPSYSTADGLKVYLDNADISQNLVGRENWSLSHNLSGLSNGNHSIEVVVKDTLEREVSKSITFEVVDAIIHINEPPTGYYLLINSSSSIKIEGSASSKAGVSKMEFWRENNYMGDITYDSNTKNWEYLYSPTNTSQEITYVSTIKLYDNDGNIESKDFNLKHTSLGKISGLLVDANTGTSIIGADIIIRNGESGSNFYEVVDNITTTQPQNDINFTSSFLPTGQYLLEYNYPNYITIEEHVALTCCSGKITGHTAIVKDDFTSNEYRFVLTWDTNPLDLDLHITFPDPTEYGNGQNGRGHVYWPTNFTGSKTSPPYVKIDQTDMLSYGPETISVKENCLSSINSGGQGLIKLSVLDFNNAVSSSSSELQTLSDARISVYKEGIGRITEIEINNATNPNNPGSNEGVLWKVLTIDPANSNVLTIVNELDNPADQTGSSNDISDNFDNFDW